MKIAFVLFTHLPNDDRIWFHQIKTLKSYNCDIAVCSAFVDNAKTNDSPPFDNVTVYQFDHSAMSHKKSLQTMVDFMLKISPDTVICDSPLSVVAMHKYKKKYYDKLRIVYDVTEWYPSKKNLVNLNIVNKIIKYCILSSVNLYAGIKTDEFIFGECFKAKLFLRLFPRKHHIFLPYYPDLSYIPYQNNEIHNNTWNLAYCGNTNSDKGFDTVCKIVMQTAKDCPDINFNFNVIGGPVNCFFCNNHPIDNLSINAQGFLPFEKFCNEISHNNIFFDLRRIDHENTRCLPIKLFYYMACGRPVIFSDLMAIPKEIPEYKTVGFFLKENNIVPYGISCLKHYIANINSPNSDYWKHSHSALLLSKEKYNWHNIEQQLINFILHE